MLDQQNSQEPTQWEVHGVPPPINSSAEELMGHPDRKLCEEFAQNSESLLALQDEYYQKGVLDTASGVGIFIGVVLILILVIRFAVNRTIP